MYALPSPELDSTISSSEEEDLESTDTTDSSPTKHWDIHSIDMSSSHFKSLPVEVRHEILTDLKETRKQNSWGRLHELPKYSNDFALYQMKRLLKRQAVQSALDDAEKEMGGHSLSLAELESILKNHGVATTNDIGKRIASDENTRYLYIKDVKQAIEIARKEQLKLDSLQEENTSDNDAILDNKSKTRADLEFEDDLKKAITLSLQQEPSTSKTEEIFGSSDNQNKPQFSFLENFNDADFESDDSDVVEVSFKKKISSAESYMMEYSGLTPNEINRILNDKKTVVLKDSKDKMVVKSISQTVPEIKLNTNDNNDSSENENIQFGNKDNTTNKEEISISIFTNESSDIKKSLDEVNETNADGINKVKITVRENVKADNISLVLNNDTSSDDEFEEVSEETVSISKDSMEIVIDPSQRLEDDIFDDIFDKKDKVKIDIFETKTIVQEKCEDNLFNDISESNKEQDENGISGVTEKKSETEMNYLEIKTNEEDAVNEKSKISTSNQNTLTVEAENFHTSNLEKSIEPKIQNLKLEEMRRLKDDLQKEKIDILVEKSIKERMASNITDQMYQEAQVFCFSLFFFKKKN